MFLIAHGLPIPARKCIYAQRRRATLYAIILCTQYPKENPELRNPINGSLMLNSPSKMESSLPYATPIACGFQNTIPGSATCLIARSLL